MQIHATTDRAGAPQKDDHRPALSGMIVVVAASIWGTSGLFIRAAGMPAVAITFFRMVVPAVVLGLWFLARRHRLSRDHLGTRLVASLLNAVRMYFYFLAFENTSIATATVALYSWPIFATIFGKLLLGEPVGRRRTALLTLAFAGIPLLYLPSGAGTDITRDIIGVSSMILSAMIHAFAVVLFRRAKTGNSRLETTFFQNILGAVIFAVIFFSARIPVTPRQVTIGLSQGLIVGTLGFTLFFIGLHRLGAGGASILTYTEVVVAVLLGTIVLGEPLHWNIVAGGLLITVAVILALRSSAAPDRVPPPGRQIFLSKTRNRPGMR